MGRESEDKRVAARRPEDLGSLRDQSQTKRKREGEECRSGADARVAREDAPHGHPHTETSVQQQLPFHSYRIESYMVGCKSRYQISLSLSLAFSLSPSDIRKPFRLSHPLSSFIRSHELLLDGTHEPLGRASEGERGREREWSGKGHMPEEETTTEPAAEEPELRECHRESPRIPPSPSPSF